MTISAPIAAHYYDGRSAKRHHVTLSVNGDNLSIAGDGVQRTAPLNELRISEPLGAAPRLITFADGAFCEVRDHAALAAMLKATKHRDNFIVRWQSAGTAILCCVVLLIASMWGAYRFGIPWMAKTAAPLVPTAVLKQIDSAVLIQLEQKMMEPSALSSEVQQQLRARFNRLTASHPTPLTFQILFRSSKKIGANAFALPGGTIVVTDELVKLAKNDEEVLAVLAHELGHVQKRHGIRSMLQASAVSATVIWLTGDISYLITAAPIFLMNMHYSRDLEREADRYAVDLLAANQISPSYLADLLEKIEASHIAQSETVKAGKDKKGKENKENKEDTKNKNDSSSSSYSSYLSSHPATSERLRFLREQNTSAPPQKTLAP